MDRTSRRRARGLRSAVTALAVVGSMAQGRPPDALTQARQFYNDHRYDEAIKAAAEAQRTAELASPAAVVLARAYLERYRVAPNPADLDAARAALKSVDATTLGARDRVELSVGLGEALYLDDQSAFDDRYSAAAEQFEIALGRADLLDPPSRDRLFDWWALALDRQAQLGPQGGRAAAYARVVTRAELELARDPSSPSAAYWLAVATYGADDLARAWGAAVSGWVRAPSLGERGAGLRADLDRLVTRVLLPARATRLAAGGDARPILALLEARWNEIKAQWR